MGGDRVSGELEPNDDQRIQRHVLKHIGKKNAREMAAELGVSPEEILRAKREIIESVEYGIYAPNFGGGQVDITSGKFVFSTSEAYLIENGKVTKPVKGATLIGSGIEAMQQISMVGNDLKLDNGVGVCGKEGQSLPVGVGQPTLKVDNLTVGGTA